MNNRERPAGDEMKALGTVPADTHSMKREDLPTLSFSFVLDDIRVRRCEYVAKFKFRRKWP